MERDSHAIRNVAIGAAATVLGTLVSTVILWMVGKLGSVLGATWVWIAWLGGVAWSAVIYPVPVPAGVLALVLAVLLAGAWRFLLHRYLMARQAPLEPTWSDVYRTDVFHGIRWRWSYDYDSRSIKNVRGYCPEDETPLVIKSLYAPVKFGGPPIGFRLECETCGSQSDDFTGRLDKLQGAVARQVERKIRTGEWEQAVAEQGQGKDDGTQS